MNSISELLDALFPGDRELGMPRFSEISTTITQRFFQEASPYIAEIEKIFSKEIRGDDCLTEVIHLRQRLPVTMRAFTTIALQTYFAEPKVIALLGNREVALFPHSRTLPEIDYELLEPVMELQGKGFE
jgi:hypothetical protein